MRETRIMHFDYYVGEGIQDYESELREKLKLES